MANNVLVTGGAGYIGSHACKALAAAGYIPVTLDNLVYGHRAAVRWGPFVDGDVGDPQVVRDVLRTHAIEAVMHFAGYAYVGESMHEPGKYFRNNFSNTVTLLDAMRAENVQSIVFSSTCATYGDPISLPIGEDHPQQPVNPYGESKLFVERLLGWFSAAHGTRYAALRYFNAAGADADGETGEDHDPETHLIPLAIEAALGLRPHLSIFGTDYDTPDGTAIRDYIHWCGPALSRRRKPGGCRNGNDCPGFRCAQHRATFGPRPDHPSGRDSISRPGVTLARWSTIAATSFPEARTFSRSRSPIAKHRY